MYKHECLVSYEVPKFIAPALVKNGKVSFRLNIHLQGCKVSEMTLNAKVKTNKLRLLYLIVPSGLSCIRFTQLLLELQ